MARELAFDQARPHRTARHRAPVLATGKDPLTTVGERAGRPWPADATARRTEYARDRACLR